MAKKKILIIDDERELVETLLFRMESASYEAIAAYDGEEGLAKARREKPDLILLDVMMPKMNGYQVCWELKNDVTTKAIPVIMLTVKDQDDDQFWGKDMGADDYFTKPFEAALLMAKIGALLK